MSMDLREHENNRKLKLFGCREYTPEAFQIGDIKTAERHMFPFGKLQRFIQGNKHN